ncbi:molybdopterin-binding oxidoreductase [Halorubrum salipaludis]|uniref:Molybdopterin-binding oxidoreductase n=1 Tax=Halorubrum salipaludis TaxID=2032630 RepID=A0A2A2FJ25_9EURY|nr:MULTISPECIES: molybdopterin-dependent oxidoreductase [Halorubrum]PAU84870.1 molybdopterin-binding oxidoreductase [Halorubrum salipaludis]
MTAHESRRRDAAVSVAAGVLAVAASYAVAGATASFVASPIDRAIVDGTPGAIVTFMIENVGEPAHLLHLGGAVAVAVGLFGACVFGGLRVAHRVGRPLGGTVLAAGAAWLLATGLTGAPVSAVAAGLSAGVVTAAGVSGAVPDAVDPSRRQALAAVAAIVGVSGAAALIGRNRGGDAAPAAAPAPGAAGAEARLGEVEAASLDVASDDLHGLVSPIDEFYSVDIAEFEPEIPAAEWSLTFTGETGSDLTVDYDELTEREAEHRLVALRCVGEDINERKLDAAVWTGTPIAPLIDAVDPEGACDCAMLRGEDGYYVQFPVDVLSEGFLAWGMNGRALPPTHGRPVRVLIPGHWGETNVKWLTEIELLETEEDGYWEERGWEGTGPVNTVAKLWDEGITDLGDGRTELAGHAYAGTRGIDRVEVSTDGGETWTDAELSAELPDEDAWRQWRHVFEPDGAHEVVVRATDGEGTLQPAAESGSVPSGASGWVSRTVNG